ncbi:hypothetical protein PAXRUDRAFT_176779 [Paxillus rubicundulus Ve08.2h10]|uniref:Uncharacterized protein n=1 Tax=Paxillus rubicundulus Ve08.2h10 TaxID=930991 RepID=A0A0D0CSW7_9AGAM|nr:hypothetical protein PAXRUDRAFT_176779 [Paxillus rubicundulus Ve08.2h10]
MPRHSHLTNLPCRHERLKTAPTKMSAEPEHTVYAPCRAGYWWSVPEPQDTRTRGRGACTLTPHTIDTTRSPMCHELPYRVIMLEHSTLALYTDIAASRTHPL